MKFHMNLSAKNDCPPEYRKNKVKQFKEFLLYFAVTFLGIFGLTFFTVCFW